MAFYPDELSPIEKLRNAGKSPELADLSLISMNRRQWKSMVLGKKDLGMNNFATITEEKEEDISSDGSYGANAGNKQSEMFASVHNKKITFPKPRKYISSRVAEREEEPLTTPESVTPLVNESPLDKKTNNPDGLSNVTNVAKMNLPEVRQLIKGKKPAEEDFQPQQEIMINYALGDMSLDKQWKDIMNTSALTGWPKQEDDKAKPKEEKKKAASGKAANKKLEQKKTQEGGGKSTKILAKAEGKNKSLNMKDVVNVYKNLTYGTKDEIKTFVESLPFVEGEEKAENNKNMLSMMNLKVLETKIKDLEKKTGQSGTVKKRGKKPRKAHTDSLARHKVIKVPATLDYMHSPGSRNFTYAGSTGEQKRKSNEEKAPWKYVGTQSVLDKKYLVYPSYPLPERKKSVKKPESEGKKVKKDGRGEETPKAKLSHSKVKQSKGVIIREISGIKSEGSNGFALSPNRFSATTVCKVEFRPETERRAVESEPSDRSLLVYLHGTKATFVRSPYSDKQFSRVKFFRRDGSRTPLIKGVAVGDGNRSVRTPTNKPASPNLYDFLDFDEDIQNINEFLRSRSPSGRPTAGKEGKSSRNGRGTFRRKLTDDGTLVDEITRDLNSLQFLPDTEENRRIIGHFFDELDRRIETTKTRKILGDNNKNNDNNNNNNCLIPIIGY